MQVPQDLLDDIKAGVRRLVDEMHLSAAPEATAYLRLLGTEIGYMKTSDISKVAETLFMYSHVFFKILPSQVSSATWASFIGQSRGFSIWFYFEAFSIRNLLVKEKEPLTTLCSL